MFSSSKSRKSLLGFFLGSCLFIGKTVSQKSPYISLAIPTLVPGKRWCNYCDRLKLTASHSSRKLLSSSTSLLNSERKKILARKKVEMVVWFIITSVTYHSPLVNFCSFSVFFIDSWLMYLLNTGHPKILSLSFSKIPLLHFNTCAMIFSKYLLRTLLS